MARYRRKKPRFEREHHERWLVSYSDFITLLFAFFVVMYSVSSINESKYRVLSDTLDHAFSSPNRSIDPVRIGKLARQNKTVPMIVPMESSAMEANEKLVKVMELQQQHDQLIMISNQIEDVLSPYIDQEQIEVSRDDLWLKVEMKSSLLFASGSAKLAGEAIPVLGKIGELFRQLPNTIHVEGFTDDRPIETPEFPSNWELSAGRAASVVSQLVKGGVSPERMAAIGYGEYHPVADNRTEQGREKNRRVVLVLLAQSASRFKMPGSEVVQLQISEPDDVAAAKTGLASGN